MDKARNCLAFTDLVVSTESFKIYRKSSLHYNKLLWKINCRRHTIKVLPELLEDPDFIELIKDGLIIGSRYQFTLLKKGNYLINAKLIT